MMMESFVYQMSSLALRWFMTLVEMRESGLFRRWIYPCLFCTHFTERIHCRVRKCVTSGIQSSKGSQKAEISIWKRLTSHSICGSAHHSSIILWAMLGSWKIACGIPRVTCKLVGCWLCMPRTSPGRTTLASSQRRVIPPIRKAYWCASLQKRHWAKQRQIAWSLCNCHWIKRPFSYTFM